MSANDEYIKKLLEEQARTEAEKKALIEEFTKSIPAEWSPEDLKEKVKDLLAQSYARIAQTINSDNESLAFKAATYAFDIGIGKIAIKDTNESEFEAFIKTLKPKSAAEKNEEILQDMIQEVKDANGTDASTDSK